MDVACSADGSSQAVLDFNYGDFGPEPGSIYISKDAGLSWRTQWLPNGGQMFYRLTQRLNKPETSIAAGSWVEHSVWTARMLTRLEQSELRTVW
jgi:hypothetical protein